MPKRRGAKLKPVARRTQEQRRRETQESVLRAALAVLIEDGYEKFTTTRVARAAGVSRGAQENYFRTKNELIVAATRYTLTQAAEQARALASRNARSSDPIGAFLANSKSFFFSPTYLALMEIVAVARRNAELARVNTPIVRQFRNILNTIWIDALCEAGYEPRSVESFVKMTHYLLRGMALTSVFQPRRSEFPRMLDDWRRIASRELKRK
jgi:AcrR family transcriptional regulator